jgi:hypothetical protein
VVFVGVFGMKILACIIDNLNNIFGVHVFRHVLKHIFKREFIGFEHNKYNNNSTIRIYL